MARPTGRPVREELLAAATTLIQERGVSSFSYNVLAEQIGIKAPSIHHHFKRKEDLVAAVAAEYRADSRQQLQELHADSTVGLLTAYADLFARNASGDRMCLCGAVASDWANVGALARREVEGYFEDQVEWISDRIKDGVAAGELRPDLEVEATARALLSSLEGALLLKRAAPSNDPVRSVGALLCSLIQPSHQN